MPARSSLSHEGSLRNADVSFWGWQNGSPDAFGMRFDRAVQG